MTELKYDNWQLNKQENNENGYDELKTSSNTNIIEIKMAKVILWKNWIFQSLTMWIRLRQ